MSARAIHPSEAERSAMAELVSRRERCQVVLKPPALFKEVTAKAVPKQHEACDYNRLPRITEREEDNDHPLSHDWGGETVAQKIADEHGWKFLGCGAHRCGFMVQNGKAILKVGKPKPTFRNINGYQANRLETISTMVAEEGVRKLLAPVVSHSTKNFKWIVVPPARTIDTDKLTYEERKKALKDVEYGLDALGADCSDLHLGNVGLLAGHPVVIDIGVGVTCKRRKPSQRKLSQFMPPQYEPSRVARHVGAQIGKEDIKKSFSAGIVLKRASRAFDEYMELRATSKDRAREGFYVWLSRARKHDEEGAVGEALRDIEHARSVIRSAKKRA